jgi:parallel beta-helix repeat protein
MKHLACIATTLISLVLVSTTAMGGALEKQLEALRADLGGLSANPAELAQEMRKGLRVLRAQVNAIQPQNIPLADARPQPKPLMARGRVATIPSALARLYLNDLRGNSAPDLQERVLPSLTLVISAGRLTLSQLLEEAEKNVPGALRREPDGVVASMPIIIWSDAELDLGSGDKLTLAGSSQSFILNMGLFRLDGASIRFDEKSKGPEPASPPFIATVSGGVIHARGSLFESLNRASEAEIASIVISTSLLSLRQEKSILEGNTFKNLGGLALFHAKDVDVRGNVFAGALGPSTILVGSGSVAVTVANNAVKSGAGDGIRIEHGANSVVVSGNLVSDQAADGIAVDRASCVNIHDNLVFANGENGIKLSSSEDVVLTANHIVQNVAAGVFVRNQAKEFVTTLNGNLFAENAVGIRGLAAGQIEIAANRMTAQLPVVVAGDLPDSLNALLVNTSNFQRTRLEAASWAAARDDAFATATAIKAAAHCKNGS